MYTFLVLMHLKKRGGKHTFIFVALDLLIKVNQLEIG